MLVDVPMPELNELLRAHERHRRGVQVRSRRLSRRRAEPAGAVARRDPRPRPAPPDRSTRRSAAATAPTARDTEAYRASMAKREAARKAILAVMDAEKLTALVYPTIRRKASPIGEAQAGANCQLSPTTGLPALSVPAGFTPDGLPVGVEFVGRPFADAEMLQLGDAFERATRARRPPASTPPLTAASARTAANREPADARARFGPDRTGDRRRISTAVSERARVRPRAVRRQRLRCSAPRHPPHAAPARGRHGTDGGIPDRPSPAQRRDLLHRASSLFATRIVRISLPDGFICVCSRGSNRSDNCWGRSWYSANSTASAEVPGSVPIPNSWFGSKFPVLKCEVPSSTHSEPGHLHAVFEWNRGTSPIQNREPGTEPGIRNPGTRTRNLKGNNPIRIDFPLHRVVVLSPTACRRTRWSVDRPSAMPSWRS